MNSHILFFLFLLGFPSLALAGPAIIFNGATTSTTLKVKGVKAPNGKGTVLGLGARFGTSGKKRVFFEASGFVAQRSLDQAIVTDGSTNRYMIKSLLAQGGLTVRIANPFFLITGIEFGLNILSTQASSSNSLSLASPFSNSFYIGLRYLFKPDKPKTFLLEALYNSGIGKRDSWVFSDMSAGLGYRF